MYELIRVSEQDFYIDCPSKIGLVYTGESGVCAIDSGSDKDAGKKVLRHIEASGRRLEAVLLTHSHADHIGGCRLLQERTGCEVYAPGLEQAYTVHPELEGMTLYGGRPVKELKNKFLLAQSCVCRPLTEYKGPIESVPLPGHSFDMAGYRTPCGTFYIGDAVSSGETLEKYGIGYLWSVQDMLDTLEKLPSLQAACYVPAHAPACADISVPAETNRRAVLAAADTILNACGAGACFEDILQGVFAAYGLQMTAQQYALIGSTVRSYLTWLYEQGRAEFVFEENRMLWKVKTE